GESANVRKAIEAAGNESSRANYREQAAVIDRVLAGVLEMAEKIRPFDVFLSYKETDDSGHRTEDSGIAQDLYTHLSGQGYRVFFARVTLKAEALGEEYEPVIFAALRSARAMVVLGTRPEYFEAPWVRNEWRRYQELAAEHPDKHLFVAFKGMEAYDLPKELKRLQAVDLGGLTALRDLEQSIEKALGRAKTAQSGDPGANLADQMAQKQLDALLDALFELIRNGRFDRAEEQLAKIMDAPGGLRSHRFHLGRLMVSLKMKDLAEYPSPITGIAHYAEAMRLGDETEQAALRAKAIAVEQGMLRRQVEALAEGRFNEAMELGVTVLEEQCPKFKPEIPAFDPGQAPRKLLRAVSRGEAAATLTAKAPRESADPLTAPGLDSHGFHQACIGNLKAALCARDDAELSRAPHPIDDHPWYQRALSLGDDAEKAALRSLAVSVENNLLRSQAEALAAGDFAKALECGEIVLGEKSPDWNYAIPVFTPQDTPNQWVLAVERGEKARRASGQISSLSYPDACNAPCLDNHGYHQACIGNLKAVLRVRDNAELSEASHPIDGHPWYQRALSLGDDAEKEALRGLAATVEKCLLQRQAKALETWNFAEALQLGQNLLAEESAGWDPRPLTVDGPVDLDLFFSLNHEAFLRPEQAPLAMERDKSVIVRKTAREAASLKQGQVGFARPEKVQENLYLDSEDYFLACVGNLKASLMAGDSLASCRYPVDAHPWYSRAFLFANSAQKTWLAEQAEAALANYARDLLSWEEKHTSRSVQDGCLHFLAGKKRWMEVQLADALEEAERKFAAFYEGSQKKEIEPDSAMSEVIDKFKSQCLSVIKAFRHGLEEISSLYSAMADRCGMLEGHPGAAERRDRWEKDSQSFGPDGATAQFLMESARRMLPLESDFRPLFSLTLQNCRLRAGKFGEATGIGLELLDIDPADCPDLCPSPMAIDLDITPRGIMEFALDIGGLPPDGTGARLNIDFKAWESFVSRHMDKIKCLDRGIAFNACVGNLKAAYETRGGLGSCRLPIHVHPWYKLALALANYPEKELLQKKTQTAHRHYSRDLDAWMELFNDGTVEETLAQFIENQKNHFHEKMAFIMESMSKNIFQGACEGGEVRKIEPVRKIAEATAFQAFRNLRCEEDAAERGRTLLRELSCYFALSAEKCGIVGSGPDMESRRAKCLIAARDAGPDGKWTGWLPRLRAHEPKLRNFFNMKKNVHFLAAKEHVRTENRKRRRLPEIIQQKGRTIGLPVSLLVVAALVYLNHVFGYLPFFERFMGEIVDASLYRRTLVPAMWDIGKPFAILMACALSTLGALKLLKIGTFHASRFFWLTQTGMVAWLVFALRYYTELDSLYGSLDPSLVPGFIVGALPLIIWTCTTGL
ncbi:MAG: toll/interleukin-1 receptor domain-containing protein, partial [Planctomycetes bacterium]|nr:toll/interleukin-1 receptor domain-containing protein [Planctomycetota bacterium]